jgi:hypothetical protein
MGGIATGKSLAAADVLYSGCSLAEDYKTTLTVIGAQYASAAKLLLDGFAALDKAGLRAKIDTLGLAVALKESGGDPLPRVVTEGPRE